LDIFGGQDFHAGDFAAFVAEQLTKSGAAVSVEGQANRGLAEIFVRWPESAVSVKVQLARMSSFHLEPPIDTRDGMPVASFRDVVAGKLHALCDRVVVRDLIDLHATLWRPADGRPAAEIDVRTRLAVHAADLSASDPGLGPAQLALAVERARRAADLSRFPLRLIVPVSDATLQHTCRVVLDALETDIANRFHR
jgi:hypothetical protein